jgi:hypothetical protein
VASAFASYIEDKVPTTTLVAMPLFHNAKAVALWDILSKGALQPHYCEEFKEPLVYLFYGRAAYKVGADTGSRSDDFWSPVSIVMEPGCVPSIKRIYPFDTGGFATRYREHIPDYLSRDRFLLDGSPQIAQKLVDLFFGSNRNYLRGKKEFRGADVEFRHLEVRAYLSVLNSAGSMPFDDRAYTIEYQIDSEIDLSKCVIAVSAPSEAFDDPQIYSLVVDQWKALPLPYDTFRGGNAEIQHGQMFVQVRAFLEHRGYI